MMMNKDRLAQAQQYAAQHYTIHLSHDKLADHSVIYVAQHPELPGCKAQGATPVEAVNNLRDARIDYLYYLLEDGLAIPVPQPQALARLTRVNLALNIIPPPILFDKPADQPPEDHSTPALWHNTGT
ncbi:MAG: type II toxin-antitoxin system HicB family antitoxin [Anaerolineae bacterium]|jgi:predicted RNase H-like HicB family nuclease|nr:type II toxin-antitoxin system HicB family antitoxin [Anaerolineae bacterium]